MILHLIADGRHVADHRNAHLLQQRTRSDA